MFAPEGANMTPTLPHTVYLYTVYSFLFGGRGEEAYSLYSLCSLYSLYTPTTLIKKQWHLTEQCGVSYLCSCISFQLYIFLFGVSYLVSVVFFGFLVFLVGWGGGYIKE